MISQPHPMLLETLKSLVKRSRKRKDPNLQTRLLPDLVENPPSKLATTPSDTTHTRAHPGNAQGLNARPPDAGEQAANQSSASTHCPVSIDHPAPASTYFPNAQNFVINSSTTIANIINFSGIGELGSCPCLCSYTFPPSSTTCCSKENSWR